MTSQPSNIKKPDFSQYNTLQREVKGPDDELPVDAKTGADRCFKVLYGLYALGAYWLIAKYAQHVTFSFLCVIGLYAAFVPWFIMWTCFLIKSPTLHQVHIPAARIAGWIPVSVPHSVELHRHLTAQSISVLSTVRGCQTHLMLRVATEISCCVIIFAIHNDLQYRQAELSVFEDKLDIVPACLLSAITRIFLLGHFELSRYDLFQFLLHYAGAFFTLSSCVGLVVMDEYSAFSKALSSIVLFFTVAFFTTSELVPKQSDNIAVVTRCSRLCITIELMGFFFVGIMMGFILNGSGANNGNIWASPFFDSAHSACASIS